MVLLDPTLGGRIRAVLTTLFACFVEVQSFFPEVGAQGWVGTVTKVYGLALAVIYVLTHGTSAGNVAG